VAADSASSTTCVIALLDVRLLAVCEASLERLRHLARKRGVHAPNGKPNHATTFATATPFESATKIVLFSVIDTILNM
jgi:hypothetical protein